MWLRLAVSLYALSFSEFIACVCAEDEKDEKSEPTSPQGPGPSKDLPDRPPTIEIERNADPSTSQAQDGAD